MDEEQEVDPVEDEQDEQTEEEDAEEEEPDEEDSDDVTAEAETEDVTAEDDTPAPVYLPTGEGPATARLREMLDPDVNAAVQAAIQEQVSRAMQTFGVTQAAFQAAAVEHPELFRQYGGKIQMALSMFPEHERHTRKSVDIATLLATTEHKAGTPEFARELLKVAQKMNGGTQPKAKPPKDPIPAASRPPSPSSGARAQTVSNKERGIKAMIDAYGLDREEAEAAYYEANRKPVRR